jgi:hypothetical protein
MMKQTRIWELDALRGLCILGMVAVHLVFDLQIPTGKAFAFVQNWGGVLFSCSPACALPWAAARCAGVLWCWGRGLSARQ